MMQHPDSSCDECWSHLTRDDFLEAFSHHPRIGDRATGAEAAEQASAQSASPSVKEQLARINREYEEKFGYIYIVCASGKSAEEMLAIAKSRLHNDPDVELKVAAEEQRKITHLRMEKLLEHD